MKLASDMLQTILPGCDAGVWAPVLDNTFNEFGIDTPLQQAAFIANGGVESNNFRRLVESFNYSATALPQVGPRWKTRFPPDVAQRVGRTLDHPADQVAIANIAYANILGNGDEASMDGWNFRGRGIFQLTGQDNYARCGAALGIPLESNPEMLETPEYAARSAGWFWVDKGLGPVIDNTSFFSLVGRINTARLGYAERIKYFLRAKRVYNLGDES